MKAFKSQIREQMCLQTHFKYEFSFMGNFVQSGYGEKKIQTAICMLLLRPVSFFFFFIFMGKNNFNHKGARHCRKPLGRSIRQSFKKSQLISTTVKWDQFGCSQIFLVLWDLPKLGLLEKNHSQIFLVQ